MRRIARVDQNQKEIIKALRDAGATVQPLHSIGQGCPDLLVGAKGVTHLLEVKNPKALSGVGRVMQATKDRQAAWHEKWRGVPPVKVYTVEEALKVIGR